MIAALDEKMLGIQKELLKKAGAKQDYADLTDQIDAIREEKQRLLLEDAEKEGVRQQMHGGRNRDTAAMTTIEDAKTEKHTAGSPVVHT